MNLVIEPVTTTELRNAAESVREEVFGREWGLQFSVFRKPALAEMQTLLALTESGREPVAVVTAIDTTGDRQLQDRLGLSFSKGARIARYTQLAVLKQYRGLNIPVRLALEARRRFVVPGGFDYTWFLFDPVRAASCSFCKLLGYQAGLRTFQTEYGCSRVLLRKETAPMTAFRDQQIQQYLDSLDGSSCVVNSRKDKPYLPDGFGQTNVYCAPRESSIVFNV